jgi:tRNA(Ile)-lysidine synthase
VGPHPAVAAVRHAVRHALDGLAPPALVLVGCSGGADSLALAAAAAFEAPRSGLRAGAVVVDHGLQPSSADVAAKVSATLAGLGLAPVVSVRAQVSARGAGHYQGPEGSARDARYAALVSAAQAHDAAAVLLGHTLDDQAETVLLGLARGSGARSLAGMAAVSGLYRRPLLGLRREQTRAACSALGLQPWDDPQNADPSFARVRVRLDVMPALESALGPGVPEALARTAQLLREDADVLDEITADAAGKAGGGAGWAVADLATLPAAIRHRVLRTAALAAGCPAGALSERHITALDRLVTDWHGQRGADLPGGLRCTRQYGRLLFTAGVTGVVPRDSTDGARAEGQRGRE